MADDCIFCKIVAGELPSHNVQEDEHTIAFMDINPWTRGHALVIPRNHSKNLYEVPEEDLERTTSASKRLALTMRDRLGCDGVNLLNCCEPAAWQTVFHMHMHVIPRYEDDPLRLPGAAAAGGAGRARAGRRRSCAVAEPVRLERDGALGQLVLDAPPLNLFSEEVFSGLERAVEQTDGLRALSSARRGAISPAAST